MRKWPLILSTLVVLALGGKYIYATLNRPDDRTLIKRALGDALQASKEGRTGGVVDMLSENFKVNDVQPGIRQVVDYVKNNHPDIDVKDTDPVVSGDTAQITSDVAVKVNAFGSPQSFTFKDAQMLFKKETAMDWLIIPTSKWHLSAVRVSTENLPTLPVQ